MGFGVDFLLCACVCVHSHSSFYDVVQVIKEDLFGDVAEERDVGKIADKIPEARASRSRLSLQLLAQIISGEELNAVINPIKEVMSFETQCCCHIFAAILILTE